MLIDALRRNVVLRNVYFLTSPIKQFFRFRLVSFIKGYYQFYKSYREFRQQGENKNFTHSDLFPCLSDNTATTPLEPTYFFQDSWAAKHIFSLNPSHHYDVGSSAKTMGIISQFTPTTMVDIRPIELELPNLFFEQGSILDLPFKDNSIESLSSLCVIEHIGLARYGDPVDALGSEKAIFEIQRVLKPGGVALISVPVDQGNKIYFNAHRAFTRDYVLSLFDEMEVLEEKYHYGNSLYDRYDPKKGFGTGLYKLRKSSPNH